MSRIVFIHTQFRDLEVLKTCLEHLDCQVLHQEEGITMPGVRTPVQVLAHTPFGPLGFRLSHDGSYELVADDMILERQKNFVDRLTQQYAYRKILKDAKAAGYNLVQEEVEEDHTIKLVVRKW